MRTELTDLVEIERKVSGDGAIQTGLEERRPPIAEAVWPATIVFAHASHSRIHSLRETQMFQEPVRHGKQQKTKLKNVHTHGRLRKQIKT